MQSALKQTASKLEEYRYKPTLFCAEFLGIDLHEGQRTWMRNSVLRENALVTGNRWGKSYVAAVKAIYKCAYLKGWSPEEIARYTNAHQPYRAINVSISAQQAKLVWEKAELALRGKKAKWLVKDVKYSPFPRIEFFNGAIFEARTTGNDGKYLLGENYDHMNWDEAANEPKFIHIRDNVLRMRLVDRHGTLDYTSTGNGRNDFGRYFLTGLPGPNKDPLLYSQTGSTTDNPYIDREATERNAARMSDKMRRQNIYGQIVDGGGEYFSREDIGNAIDSSLLMGVCEFDDEERECRVIASRDHKLWPEAYPGHRYVHGWDLADKADFTVGQTFDISTTPYTLVEFERFNKTGWSHVYDRIRTRHMKYPHSETWVDSTGLGDVVLDQLSDINAKGMRFTAKTKSEMLANIQSMLSLRQLRFPPIRVLTEEMTFYEREDSNLITDCVMSLAIAAQAINSRGDFYFSMV